MAFQIQFYLHIVMKQNNKLNAYKGLKNHLTSRKKSVPYLKENDLIFGKQKIIRTVNLQFLLCDT